MTKIGYTKIQSDGSTEVPIEIRRGLELQKGDHVLWFLNEEKKQALFEKVVSE